MVFWIWKRDLIKILKYTNCKWGCAEECLEVYENRADNLSNNITLNEISTLIFFPILQQNKLKPHRSSCRSNLWSPPILILWNIEVKILKKKPGDKVIRVSFKFPRRGWDQRLVHFNRFISVETRSCYSCLVSYLHAWANKCLEYAESTSTL